MTDRLTNLEQWLHAPPSEEFPTEERVKLLNDIAGAALEIRDLREQVETLSLAPRSQQNNASNSL